MARFLGPGGRVFVFFLRLVPGNTVVRWDRGWPAGGGRGGRLGQDETNLQQVATDKDLLLSDLQNWQFRSRRPRERKGRRRPRIFLSEAKEAKGCAW